MKLRGRTSTQDKRRGRTLSPGARGAKLLTHHGPLQRLLDEPASPDPAAPVPELDRITVTTERTANAIARAPRPHTKRKNQSGVLVRLQKDFVMIKRYPVNRNTSDSIGRSRSDSR